MNGEILQGLSNDEVRDIIKRSPTAVVLVVVEEKTESIYRNQKIFINLKNLEGCTNVNADYKPRLCTLHKGSDGFGFHLLYLEERKGEYIEEVTPESPADKAGNVQSLGI